MSDVSPHHTEVLEPSEVLRELSHAHDTIVPVSATPLSIVIPSNRTPIHDAIPTQSLPAFERYELQSELGQGGMAVIYRAYDRVLGREVIIKLMRTELLGSRTAERRFLREARTHSRLHHPGIVPLYDAGRFADSRPYLTMKLAEGRTLDAMLSERPQVSPETLAPLLHVLEQVLHTMAYAHQLGIIHRDLKPLNVVVSASGHVRVLDWGLAKVLTLADENVSDELPIDTLPHETAHGAAIGTPAFMPPEQANGERDQIDARCDVFAIGAILCWILTGAVPYATTNADVLWRMAKSGDLADAMQRLSACEPRLCRLATRWLAPNRGDRPASAVEALAEWHASQHPLTRLRRWLVG